MVLARISSPFARIVRGTEAAPTGVDQTPNATGPASTGKEAHSSDSSNPSYVNVTDKENTDLLGLGDDGDEDDPMLDEPESHMQFSSDPALAQAQRDSL